ncbi:MAG: 2-dehydropantoate 2-reductase [Yoonia sp.]|jgi:2-dehydropantoate 2-reductase
MSNYHVSVFGGGSVGLCLAAHFAKAGARVTLLVRKTAMSALDNVPIEISGALGSHTIPAGAIAIADAAKPDDHVFQSNMLILNTKADDVEAALRPFAGSPTKPSVLLMQNGIGSAEITKNVLGSGVPVFSTAMMIGMVRLAPNKADVSAYAAPIGCGTLLDEKIGPLENLLNVAQHGFVPMIQDPSIHETILSKLLLNSCLNPTGALTGQTYGQLLEDPASRQLVVDLADETLAAFSSAFDYRPAKNGQHYVDEILSSIVSKGGGRHHSSMHHDIQSGRKTEIEFLNGAIIKMARKEGLLALRHEVVTQLIRAREASKLVQ